jgi:hypothetical protein
MGIKIPRKVRDLLAWLQSQERIAQLKARVRHLEDQKRGGGGDGF